MILLMRLSHDEADLTSVLKSLFGRVWSREDLTLRWKRAEIQRKLNGRWKSTASALLIPVRWSPEIWRKAANLMVTWSRLFPANEGDQLDKLTWGEIWQYIKVRQDKRECLGKKWFLPQIVAVSEQLSSILAESGFIHQAGCWLAMGGKNKFPTTVRCRRLTDHLTNIEMIVTW